MAEIPKVIANLGKNTIKSLLLKFFPLPNNSAKISNLDLDDDKALLYSRPTENPMSRIHPELKRFTSSSSQLMGTEFWNSMKKDMPHMFQIYLLTKTIQPSNASIEIISQLSN